MGPLANMERSTARLFVMAVATLIVVAGAAAVVLADAKQFAGAIEPTPMFPGFFELAESEATSFSISSADSEIYITRNERGAWVVPARAGFPANPDLVRQTLVGLSELELIEAKTARADWHHFLGLVGPDEGGEGIEIQVTTATGESLATVVVGNQPEGQAVEQDGRGRIHVRRPNETQTWLARGSLTLRSEITDWLATQILDIGRERIQSVTVTMPGADSYTISRASADVPDFTLVDLPVGREPLSRFIVNGVATVIADLEADDVAPEAAHDFSESGTVIYNTFDGIELTFRFTAPDAEGQRWATILARFLGAPNLLEEEAAVVAEEASIVNRLTDGWAFLLADYQVRQMTLERDSLLRPLPGETSPQ